MPEAIWLLCIGLYPIRPLDAMADVSSLSMGENCERILLRLMSGSGPHCAMPLDGLPTRRIQLKPERYAITDPDVIEHHAPREDQVRAEIASRLSRVCANFSPHEFKKLVRKMAERQLRDERRLRW